MEAEETPQLEYGQPVPWRKSRRVRRIIVVLLFAAATPFALFWLMVAVDRGADAVRTYRNGRVLARCLNYRAPADQVVFEQRNGVVTTIVAAEPWAQWFAPYRNFPTVFLHRRTGENAQLYNNPELLQAVQLEPWLMHTYYGSTVADRPVLCFYPWQSQARATSSRSPGLRSGSDLLVMVPQRRDHIRVFAGQPDPADTSKFAFGVDYNGVRQTVTGQVANGLVSLTPRVGQVLTSEQFRGAKFWVPAGASDAQLQSTLEVIRSGGQPSPTTWPAITWGQPLIPQPTPTTAPAVE